MECCRQHSLPSSTATCSGGGAALEDPVNQGAHEALMSDLDSLMREHCRLLGDFVDGRLASYHQDILRALVEDSSRKSRRRGPRSASLSSRGSSRSARTFLSTRASTVTGAEARAAFSARASTATAAAALCRAASPQTPETPPEALQETHNYALQSKQVSFLELGGHNEDGDCTTKPPDPQGGSGTTQSLGSLDEVCTFDQTDKLKEMKSRKVSHKALRAMRSFEVPKTKRFKEIVDSSWFEGFLCLLIASNVLFFGFEVQSLFGLDQDNIPMHFRVAEYTYTALFSIELLLRVLAHGTAPFVRGENRIWNIIDVCLVAISFVDFGLQLLDLDGNRKLTYARAIRVFKTVRVFRVVRIMKFFRPLRILVYSILNTLRSLCWTLVLLAIIVYLFAVMFTMASSDALARNDASDPGVLKQYFGSLWRSISTLFQCITGGMDWRFSSDALSTLDPIWMMLFVAYIAFSQFALLNVVTGVVCQTAIESAQQDQDIVVQTQLANKEKYVRKLENLFRDLDSESVGKITLTKLEERLQDSSLKAYLDALDLTADQAWNLFKLLDVGETSMIGVDEFVSGCLKLRGTARSLDIHMLMYESRWTMNKLTKLMLAVQDLTFSIEELQDQQLPPADLTSSMRSDVRSADDGMMVSF